MRDFLTTQLLEPNLLVPGRKPIGPVEQDNDHSLSRKLMARLLMGEGSGNRVRDLVKQNHGTLGNNPTWAIDPVKGKVLAFDGTDDYVSVQNLSGAFNISEGAISWWAKPNAAYNDGATYTWWSQITGGQYLTALKYQDDKIYVGWFVGSEQRVVFDNTADFWGQDTWSNYMFTWKDGDKAKLYRNAELVATATNNTTTATIDIAFFIGEDSRQGAQSFPFDGELSDYRVYSRIPSDIEKKEIYLNPYQDIKPALSWIPLSAPVAGAGPLVNGRLINDGLVNGRLVA